MAIVKKIQGANFFPRAKSQVILEGTDTTSYEVGSNADEIVCNPSGAMPLTLPDPSTIEGTTLRVFDISGSASTNNITLIADGTDKTINGAESFVINSDYGCVELKAVGGQYYAFVSNGVFATAGA